uniref:Glycosyltransferase family 92 protein n=1 Tax=Panagrellus redivivus TaxID=6233 RepID=A0A7E4UPR2_PANRE
MVNAHTPITKVVLHACSAGRKGRRSRTVLASVQFAPPSLQNVAVLRLSFPHEVQLTDISTWSRAQAVHEGQEGLDLATKDRKMYVFGRAVFEDCVELERLPPINSFTSNNTQPMKSIRYAINRLVMPWECKGILVAMPQSNHDFFGDMRRRERVMRRLRSYSYKVRIVDSQLYDQARILYHFGNTHKLYDNVAGLFITDNYICACVLQKESVGYLCIEQIYMVRPESWRKIVQLVRRFHVEYLPVEVVIVEDCARMCDSLLVQLNEANIQYSYREFSHGARQCHLLRWILDVFSEGKAESRMPLSQAECNFSWKVNGRTVDRIHAHENYIPCSFISQVDTYRCKSVNLYANVPFTDQSKCLATIPVPYSAERRSVTVAIQVDHSRLVSTKQLGKTEEETRINYTYDTINFENGTKCKVYRAQHIFGVLLVVFFFIGAIAWGILYFYH